MSPGISWTRRIGVVVALVAVGGTVVLAAGGFGPGPHGPTPSGSQRPSAGASRSSVLGAGPNLAPVMATPGSTITAKHTWTLRLLVPDGLRGRRRDLKVRVFRNDRQVAELPLPKGKQITVKDIGLRRGDNRLTAAFVDPDGVGPRSEPLLVVVDDVAPSISLSEPADGATLNATSVSVRGTTEAGATITVKNLTSAAQVETTAADDGSFRTTIDLVPGENRLSIRAVDSAGNAGSVTRTVLRGTGQAAAQLALSHDTFRLRRLPATLDVHLLVVDADGVPVDGAKVTFSLSPPGQPTSTYQATTDQGRASWLGITLPRDGAVTGSGFVTARVTLPDGATVQENAPFTIE